MPSRRSVLTRLALLPTAALWPGRLLGAPAGAPAAAPRDSAAGEWDLGWLDTLRGKHKQVFDCGTLSDEENPLHVVANWLDAHQEVYGLEYPDVNVVIGIAANAFPLNASSALWEKYRLARHWKLHDPATKELATRNFLLDAPADSPRAKMTVKALQGRGAIFWQCNNALTSIARTIAEKTSQEFPAVYDELKAGLNPGVRLVPAHTMLIGLTQERGCAYEKL